MLGCNPRRAAALLSVAGLCAVVNAGPFSAGSIVVMRVSKANVGGSGSVVLAEYTRAGVFTGNTVEFPACGPDAISMPDLTNHDRHIHLSTDHRFLAVAAYNAEPSMIDPSGETAGSVPRIMAIVKFDGSFDLSTRLNSTFENTSVRGAFTTDGHNIWIAGDNAGGATTSGGLRFTTLGSSSTENLSQVQTIGGSKTTDNVRDVNVFDAQLYDCSGSSSSIGKGVFSVGTGLPTSGSQTVSAPLNGSDGASTSSFALLDCNPSVPGVDVLYTATSAAGDGVHKYVKQSNGTWISMGYTAYPGIEHVIAERNANGTVSLFVGGALGVAALTDATPLTGALSGSVSSFMIAPTDDYSIGGIDFAPAATCQSGPTIATQPHNASTCPDGVAAFSIALTGAGPFSYQWQLEASPGVWTTLGPCPKSLDCDSGEVWAENAQTPSTTVHLTLCELVGTTYAVRCIVSNDCGTTISNTANFRICPGDFNCDGFVNGDDYDAFASLFESADAAADFTRDGFVNGDDYDAFASAFDAGC